MSYFVFLVVVVLRNSDGENISERTQFSRIMYKYIETRTSLYELLETKPSKLLFK